MLGLCVLGDEGKRALVGQFRLSLNGLSPLRFEICLTNILGRDPIPEAKITIVVDPKSIIFKDNAWYTAWSSLNEDILVDNVSLSPTGVTEKPLHEIKLDVRKEMVEVKNQVSYRYEVTSAESAGRMVLLLRFLPTVKSSLNGHTRFDTFDVSTIAGGEVLLQHLAFPPEMADLDTRFPLAPFLFSPVHVNEEEYRAMIDEGYQSVLNPIRVHGDLALDQVEQYLSAPAQGPVVNSPRFNPNIEQAAKKAKVDKKDHAEFDNATGTYQLVKFGTNRPILDYIYENNMTQREIQFLCYHLRKGTWNSYITHWNTFLKFCDDNGKSKGLPIEINNLIDYLCYLRIDKKLEYKSVLCYISGLKKLHQINGADLTVFDNPRIGNVLKGIEHDTVVQKEVETHRCVVTWSVMVLLGHQLAVGKFHPWDRQMLWTLMLFAYFGARRMGELITTSKKSYDQYTVISWDKVQWQSDDHITMSINLPKVVPKGHVGGIVVGFKSWKGQPGYCPVQNFVKLASMVGVDKTKDPDPVFRLANGDLVTQDFMNDLLDKLLTPLFPPSIGKWSCHSFRAGITSTMATNPHKFDEEDSRIIGGWDSDSVSYYQRLNGYARLKAQDKFYDHLRYNIVNCKMLFAGLVFSLKALLNVMYRAGLVFSLKAGIMC